MTNIEQNTSYSPTGNNDSSDRAREVENWNIEQLMHNADQHGVDISDHHLDVIHFLRDYYVENGWPKKTHELTRLLDKKFKHIGGKRYLHQLFPQGPLTQGAQLAGLPALYNVVDRSFGTAH
ncbi:MAG: TusE/DsrC/DsvC family sulfur relay protein [Gammaproteobacteria bacterium]|nr:TusE/DsrC/DsvC family sulfur relay protein [Gammaproteobacteria bacterium]NNJ48886.1 TusE/DsrC/DsvC family sulfur relay protein [Gammaproteobacteria bacterium]